MPTAATASAGFGHDFCLTLLTKDPRLAAEADSAGVNRIGVDLERLGKAERQPSPDSRISDHTWQDLARIAPSVQRADLFAESIPFTKPPNPKSRALWVLE